MHEYKHSELETSRGSRGKLVKSRRQVVAIALHEAGATRQEGPKINWENLTKTEKKTAKGMRE
jgi:hypothetical protein